MPATTQQSVSWPLKVLCIGIFVSGIIGLLYPGIGALSGSTSWILIGISIALALALLFPTLVEIVRKGAITAELNKMTVCLDSAVASIGTLAKKMEADGPIGAKLGETETRLGDRLSSIEKQLKEVIRPTDGRLAVIDSKLNSQFAKIEERLGQLSEFVGEKATRLDAIREAFGPEGSVGKQLKEMSAAADDPAKLKAAIDPLKKAVDEIGRRLDAIR